MSILDNPILTFRTAADWDRWLEQEHARVNGVWLKLAKKGASLQTHSYAEALDVALCWGWIDGQKRALDDEAFLQRFTPRRPRSRWSKINCGKVEKLISEGRMRPPGQREVDAAKSDGRWEAAYDGQRTATVPPDLEAALAADPKIRAAFDALDGANRFAILYRLQDAKKPETRARRLEKFVAMLAEGGRIHG